jgi:magnesium transporter
VTTITRTDFTALRQEQTVEQALEAIRKEGLGERIVYFYVVDEAGTLVGVLPTRRLLTARLEEPVSKLMIPRVVVIPETATVLEACEMFLLHRLLAFPVVDAQRRLVGVVDAGLFTEEVLDLHERERTDDLFQTIGLRVTEVQHAKPLRAFRLRSPWLVTTLVSGTLCALLAGLYETTLAQNLVLAFFLTLVLGLGESVSAQSMTVTVQALHGRRPDLSWFLRALRREIATAFLLGAACSAAVGLVVWTWRSDGWAALVIGASVLLAMTLACLIGVAVPTVLHRLRLDPKIAAGPVTLALADLGTLLFYFNLAALLQPAR